MFKVQYNMYKWMNWYYSPSGKSPGRQSGVTSLSELVHYSDDDCDRNLDLPHKSDGLVLVEDTVVRPLLIQKLRKTINSVLLQHLSQFIMPFSLFPVIFIWNTTSSLSCFLTSLCLLLDSICLNFLTFLSLGSALSSLISP